MTPAFTKILTAIALMSALGAGAASAETRWDNAHPRRFEVNTRADHLEHRIAEERRSGDLTPAEAHRMRVADKQVQARERFDARTHNGHITRGEQHRLNRAENRISRHLDR